MFTEEEQKAVVALRDDRRYQERIIAAVTAWNRYFEFGGFEQCMADRLRSWNNRASAASNVEDSRRCPRCYSLLHFSTGACPLGPTAVTPPMVATSPDSEEQTGDGRPLRAGRGGTEWGSKCKRWGHSSRQCPRCGICNRWGHASEDCGSGLNGSRNVPKGQQPPGAFGQ